MRLDRGAVVILVCLVACAGATYSAIRSPLDGVPWALGALERRIESSPALSGVIEDRKGRVLARPKFDGGRWVVDRPFGRPLSDVGVGRTRIQVHGVQGNLAGVMRTGSATLRPYETSRHWSRVLLGHPVLTAPSTSAVRTTIDAELTTEIYDLLAREGKKASVVVLHAPTGELRAVVDYPGPDVYSDVEPDGRTSLDALHGVNLPASTMKVLSAAYVLQRRPRDAHRQHVCTGDRCWTRHDLVRGIEDAVVMSCNMWFRLEGASWNRGDWLQFIVEAGLQPADTPGLPTTPILMVGHRANRMHWPQAVGQQLWVSLVGLASSFATLTSAEGRRVDPLVVLGDREGAKKPPPDIVRPAVAKRLREILRSAAVIGTARSVNQTYGPGTAGAKTGTGERDGQTSDAIFVAVAPWDKPEWVVALTLKGGASGSSVGPLAGRVLSLATR